MSIAFQGPFKDFSRFGHCVNIEVQQDGFPEPVPSGSAIFAPEKHREAFSSSTRHRIHL